MLEYAYQIAHFTNYVEDIMKATLRDCHLCLSHLRTCDSAARRRFNEEDEDAWMGLYASQFAVDTQQKLLPSKCLRRLADKTQVMTDSTNRHIRTRMTHSFEVVSIVTTIANILGLNANLMPRLSSRLLFFV